MGPLPGPPWSTPRPAPGEWKGEERGRETRSLPPGPASSSQRQDAGRGEKECSGSAMPLGSHRSAVIKAHHVRTQNGW